LVYCPKEDREHRTPEEGNDYYVPLRLTNMVMSYMCVFMQLPVQNEAHFSDDKLCQLRLFLCVLVS